MEDLEDISVLDSIKGKIDNGLEVTENEMSFLEASEINNAINKGQPVSEDEMGRAEGFANLFNMVGTDDEAQLRETLQLTGAPYTIMKSLAPSGDSLARIAGRNEGAGLLDEDSRANFFQAISNIKPGVNGLPDIESAITDFESMQAKTVAEREALKARYPEQYQQSKTATEIATAFAGGGATQKALGPMLTSIPKVLGKGSLLGAKTADVLAAGGGTVVADYLTNNDFDTLAESGLTGMGLDTALKVLGPSAKMGSQALRSFVAAQKEKALNQAGRWAVRVIAPIKRPLIRALERSRENVETTGRILLQEKVIPPFPPFFLPSSIDKRLLKARENAGSALGSLRKEAQDFNDTFMGKIRREASAEGNPQVLDAIDDIERKIRFDPSRVADRLQEYVDSFDALARNSERGGVLTRIEKNIEAFRNDPNPRTIAEALKLKEVFRTPIQKKGAFSPAIQVEADGIVNRIMADEIDTAITKSITLKKTLGEDFNTRKIEAEFGKLATRLNSGIKNIEGGAATPEQIQDVVDTMAQLDDMGSVFRAIAKSGDLLLEKNLSGQTNNFISLRDTIGASAGFQALGPEAAVGGAVISKFLRSRGSAVGAKGMEFLANRIGDLDMTIGNMTGQIGLLSDMKTLTPALYIAITRPDSPLNVHNFMVIDDKEFLDEFKARISNDDSLSSVRKSKLISEINHKGEVRIFNKGAKDKNTVQSSPGLGEFRKNLENFIPPEESVTPAEPDKKELTFGERFFPNSPLVKKKGEALEQDTREPLSVGKQIQGFLDTVMGTEQIGIDPQETFPESQINPDDLFSMQATATPGPPIGKILNINFGTGKARGLEKAIETGDIAVDLKKVSEHNKTAFNALLKDNAIDGEEKIILKKILSYGDESVNAVTKEKLIKLNSSGVTGDPYQGRDYGNIIWDQGFKQTIKLNSPLPVYKTKILDNTLGHKVAEGGIDPFAWIDHRYKATQKFLKTHGDEIKVINTRSDLIAQGDYIDMLPKNAEINIFIGPKSVRDIVGKRIEPGNPSIRRRIIAAEKLREKGFKVNIVVDEFRGKDKDLIHFLNDASDAENKGILTGAKINFVDLTPETEAKIKRVIGSVPKAPIRTTPSKDLFDQFLKDTEKFRKPKDKPPKRSQIPDIRSVPDITTKADVDDFIRTRVDFAEDMDFGTFDKNKPKIERLIKRLIDVDRNQDDRSIPKNLDEFDDILQALIKFGVIVK